MLLRSNTIALYHNEKGCLSFLWEMSRTQSLCALFRWLLIDPPLPLFRERLAPDPNDSFPRYFLFQSLFRSRSPTDTLQRHVTHGC
jgi:hypothetical protein